MSSTATTFGWRSDARSLRRALERHGQILSALAAAHRRGIIHCDLKPANLMFRRDADLPGVEVMLGDFGVAHLPDVQGQATASASSRKNEAVGTLAYMSPEQRRGELSPAADVYASAVVLYEMLAGRTPGSREGVIGGRRDADAFVLPRDVFAGADEKIVEDVQAHLNRLSNPDPAKRPTTAQAVVEAQRLRERAIAAGAS